MVSRSAIGRPEPAKWRPLLLRAQGPERTHHGAPGPHKTRKGPVAAVPSPGAVGPAVPGQSLPRKVHAAGQLVARRDALRRQGFRQRVQVHSLHSVLPACFGPSRIARDQRGDPLWTPPSTPPPALSPWLRTEGSLSPLLRSSAGTAFMLRHPAPFLALSSPELTAELETRRSGSPGSRTRPRARPRSGTRSGSTWRCRSSTRPESRGPRPK